MPDRKIVFVAFAIEDETQRNLLKWQSLNTRSPFEYIDMSVREAYDSAWKDHVRTRIRRSHGVIALASRNSLTSSGQKWEVECALAENTPILCIRAYRDDLTNPPFMRGLPIVPWGWDAIANFIDRL